MNLRWLAVMALCAAAPLKSQPPAPPAAAAAAAGPTPAVAPTAPTAPSSPVYNVELVVFRATTALGVSEEWTLEAPSDAALHPEGDSDAPATSSTPASVHFVRSLSPSEYQLNDIEARLRSSSAYAPVAHLAWAQTAGLWGTHSSLPLPRVGLEGTGLSGTVTLERGTFLHLGLVLSYALDSPPPGLGAAPGTVFTINDSHRVRFYERNYFDHPAFGVIALVTPAQARPAGR